MRKKISKIMLLAVIGLFIIAACKKECKYKGQTKEGYILDETNCEWVALPCKAIEDLRDKAENDYNSNANECLGVHVPACVNHPERGGSYRARFEETLPPANEATRQDSLNAANYAEERLRSAQSWTNGNFPEDFKEMVSNAGKTGRDALTNFDLYNQYIEEVKQCHLTNGK